MRVRRWRQSDAVHQEDAHIRDWGIRFRAGSRVNPNLHRARNCAARRAAQSCAGRRRLQLDSGRRIPELKGHRDHGKVDASIILRTRGDGSIGK